MPSWGDLLNELQRPQCGPDGSILPSMTIDDLRRKYIEKMSIETGRNVIAYYSGWLKPGRNLNTDINDSDMTGFMQAIHQMNCEKGLDLILHTPGGNPTATEGIVKYLHNKFDNVRVIVPQMAMSAGTMLACAANELVLGKHSCLGPFDPQFGGVPAYNIMQEFREAKSDLDANPQSKTYWELQLSRYPAAFFYTVLDSIALSKTLVTEWLNKYMFAADKSKGKSKKIDQIVFQLNSNNKSHSRHFDIEFCKQLGLPIKELEKDQNLQEAVLSVHHAFVITIDQSSVTKIIQSSTGATYLTRQ